MASKLLLFKIATELNVYSVNGVGIRIDGQKYCGAAYTLFTGFREKKDYQELKNNLEDFAQEVQEKYV